MKRFLCLVAALLLAPWSAPARDVAGQFDYYVLALSWSPSWCSSNADAAQCEAGRRLDFVVHGLWPQYERGWPQDCISSQRNPSRQETAAMADLVGSAGLAWHQWQKHGRCTGLSARDYFAATRRAARAVAIPAAFAGLARDITLPPALVEDAFIDENPGLGPDGIIVTCRGTLLHEVRICLTRDLTPRDCAPDIRADCGRHRVLMQTPR